MVLFAFVADRALAEDVVITLNGEHLEHEINLQVSLADEKDERERGLRFVTEMENDGMLFVFDEKGIYRVWAKDTFLSLTMFWISVDGKIVGETRLRPFDLTIHTSPSDVKFGLEMESALADELNISQGMVVESPLSIAPY